jgi:hypothetical protein
VAPDGRTWKVRRKLLTRTVRWRGPESVDASVVPDVTEVALLSDDVGCLPAVGIVATAAVAIVLSVLFVFPALVFAVEAAVVLLLVGLGVVARVLFRRPWTVEARVAGTNEGRQWKVSGWRASGELRDRVADQLRSTGAVVRFTD